MKKTTKSLITASIVLLLSLTLAITSGNRNARAEEPASIDSYLDGSIFFSEDTIDPFGDVPEFVMDKTASYIELFTKSGRGLFQNWLDQSAPYMPLVRKILREEGLPEDLAFLPLIESGFNVNARSRAKATGMWQFMASTGTHYGLSINGWIDERRDPVKSTRAAARHLKDLYETFGSWPLALASYNAGSGKIKRVLNKNNASTFWEISQNRALAVETRNYVPKFMAATIIARNPEAFGFTIMETPSFQFDLLEVPAGMDLRTLTEQSGISLELLRSMNPELKGSITPVNSSSYVLRLPKGTGDVFIENFDDLRPDKRIVYKEYKIRKGDSVNKIARKFNTRASHIKEVNKLNKKGKIVYGKTILIPVRLPNSVNAIRLLPTHDLLI